MTFAMFYLDGNLPSSKERLNSPVRDEAKVTLVSLFSLKPIPSDPDALGLQDSSDCYNKGLG